MQLYGAAHLLVEVRRLIADRSRIADSQCPPPRLPEPGQDLGRSSIQMNMRVDALERWIDGFSLQERRGREPGEQFTSGHRDFHKCSERKLQTEPELTLIHVSARDTEEVSRRNVRTWREKMRSVRHVVRFGAELQTDPLIDWECTKQADVGIEICRSAQSIAARRPNRTAVTGA